MPDQFFLDQIRMRVGVFPKTCLSCLYDGHCSFGANENQPFSRIGKFVHQQAEDRFYFSFGQSNESISALAVGLFIVGQLVLPHKLVKCRCHAIPIARSCLAA